MTWSLVAASCIVAIVALQCDGGRNTDDSSVEVPDKFNLATGVPCRHLQQMLRSKRSLAKRLQFAANDTLTKPNSMTTAEKQVQAQIIELFGEELDEFEAGIYKSLNGLDRALKANFWSLPSVKANFKRRLEGLKSASMHEEQSFNAIVELEKKQELAEQEHEKDVQRNITAHQHGAHRSVAEKLIQELVNGVVDDVVAAADKLENGMKQDQAFENIKQKEGAKLETVIKLEEDEEGVHRDVAKDTGSKKSNHSSKVSKDGLRRGGDDGDEKSKKAGGMSMLIDSHGNKYILAESATKMITHHDWHLLTSLALAVVSAFLLGVICQYLRVPVLFGYVLSGVLIGPPGYNLVQSQVQVETLGEVGVYLLLFSVGLDFSARSFREVWLVAMCGGGATTAVMQLASLLAATMLHILPQQSCFVAACLTLSSTQLAVRVLAQYNVRRKGVSPSSSSSHISMRKESLLDGSENGGVDLGEVGNGVFGILLLQDIFLAVFVALLPILAEQIADSQDQASSSHAAATIATAGVASVIRGAKAKLTTQPTGDAGMGSSSSPLSSVESSDGSADVPAPGLLYPVLSLTARTVCLSIFCYAASRTLLPPLVKKFWSSSDKYDRAICLTLGSLSMLVVCVIFTHHVGISAELGCFVAGVLLTSLTSHDRHLAQQVLASVEPVKDLFSAIFFVTIGFHVFPMFIWHEFAVVVTLTTAVVLVKFTVTYAVLSSMVSASQAGMIGLASSSVAQVSECAFLVGSRGVRLGLISREVYLLLLSITTTSQLVTPVLWYSMSGWRSRAPLMRFMKAAYTLFSKACQSVSSTCAR
ncbi:transmembrane and coiled-coil domain-containing protein 3-like [Sycon ciliatum]|uniref:transmembrane and coiled-coil domain-containing protein 3-like n=1 Tax=Sycon ciliatum TaxID=27933 RepID=UPI0031F6306A